MKRSEVLSQVDTIINGARQENYGSPENNFQRIANFWSHYLCKQISPADVAVMMVLMKVARLQNNINHEDSWIDICGYAANGCEIVTENNS